MVPLDSAREWRMKPLGVFSQHSFQYVSDSSGVFGGRSISAPAMLTSHSVFDLLVFLGKGTKRIGEPFQEHRGPTVHTWGNFFQ